MYVIWVEYKFRRIDSPASGYVTKRKHWQIQPIITNKTREFKTMTGAARRLRIILEDWTDSPVIEWIHGEIREV